MASKAQSKKNSSHGTKRKADSKLKLKQVSKKKAPVVDQTRPCDSFGHKFPQLLEEFVAAGNDRELAFTIPPGSGQSFKWKCLKANCDHHIWPAAVKDRTSGSGCGFDAGKQTCPCDSFGQKFPQLLEEFVAAGNDRKLAFTISPGSKLSFKWKCLKAKCDHVWPAVVANRTRGRGCPKCAGKYISAAPKPVPVVVAAPKPILEATVDEWSTVPEYWKSTTMDLKTFKTIDHPLDGVGRERLDIGNGHFWEQIWFTGDGEIEAKHAIKWFVHAKHRMMLAARLFNSISPKGITRVSDTTMNRNRLYTWAELVKIARELTPCRLKKMPEFLDTISQFMLEMGNKLLKIPEEKRNEMKVDMAMTIVGNNGDQNLVASHGTAYTFLDKCVCIDCIIIKMETNLEAYTAFLKRMESDPNTIVIHVLALLGKGIISSCSVVTPTRVESYANEKQLKELHEAIDNFGWAVRRLHTEFTPKLPHFHRLAVSRGSDHANPCGSGLVMIANKLYNVV